jgi:hypothetical protein
MRHAVTRRGLATLVALGSLAALAPEAPAAATPVPAGAIVLERTGGFAGGRDSFVVDGSTVGGQRPRRMAGSAAFRRLRGSYLTASACCDRYSYRVTVTYRGGYRKTVSTIQGAAAPRILWQVIAEVERVGVRSARTA